MRVAYADPPYPGQARKHYADHPDYDGEVDHRLLVQQLRGYDGWILHTSSVALPQILALLNGESYRVMAWVKPWAAYKRNVPVAYAWEPVLVKACRKPKVLPGMVSRDWIAVPMAMKRGLVGAKPEAVCRWLFQVAGMMPDDHLIDLFPGSGAVTDAWSRWSSEEVLWRNTCLPAASAGS